MEFEIYLNGKNVMKVLGYESAWNAYRIIRDAAEKLDGTAELVDAATCEVIDDWGYEDE